ncbi:MAG: 50S ribosomal protein L29 [Bacteroidetes bacterium]|nr:50S ribosomal protein L29 [Bacteroidota bacterium]MBU1720695.1 50S ribosomal protein L29 [Bacteroidota bacterium]
MKNTNVTRELSTPELLERLDEEKIQYRKLKMNHAVSPLENPMKIKAFRRNIARMQTELRKRQNEQVKS